ncbi:MULTISPECIES: hypothetical protein [Micromonospora]|uniref:hypothetical protein n=1 Tax=Micromonospora TaxID=1873 RepID=UPI001B35A369|nr:hypothetical protein [Micromonospora sp. M61]MBQ0981180.1 hypothetical protein [Micromonospora sp. M61]
MAGFHVLEAYDMAEGLPSEQEAWKSVVSSPASPGWSVALAAVDAVEQVERRWRRLVHERGLTSGDGTLLIGLTGHSDERRWVAVRLPDGPLALDALGPNPGEPEFVAMSLAGDAVCGVTAEEYELWVVCARLD